MRGLLIAVVIGLTAGVSMVERLSAQSADADKPSLLLTSRFGVDNFHAYCSPCHGRDARGRGPVAPILRTAPPDLTMLAARNHGVFPRARVLDLIANLPSDLPAHGSPQMPVWGPAFRALDSSDHAARLRLAAIVEYLSSIQRH